LSRAAPPWDGTVTDHVPPGMQRVLTRLGETPVAVFAADWQLIWWNRSWAALLGDPPSLPPEDRNLVRSRFPAGDDRGRLARDLHGDARQRRREQARPRPRRWGRPLMTSVSLVTGANCGAGS
jgi:hypothetical protein